MVCSQEISEYDHAELQLWKDFPKGLRVLLLCNDTDSASHTQIMLEQMDYIVSWYRNFEEGQKAISEKSESFHVAVVEVTTNNCSHSYKFLEAARTLPVIVISSDSSLSTMLKCISLGAAEFLQKPLSEDKLRNIWQHVIHKAFSSRDKCDTTIRTLKPIKEMVVSMFQVNQEENVERSENEIPEKLTRPSTPQLESKLRICSNNEESEERNIKSVEKTCNDSVLAPSKNKNEEVKELTKHEEEVNSIEISKSDACSSVKERRHGSCRPTGSNKNKIGSSSQASKDNKKSKVDWTPELHKRFVKAVEQLGIDRAIPSKILDLMKVEGLTRHNIASHLQKYRMHRRHILPKEEERYKTPRDTWPKSYMQRPIVAAQPPFHQFNYTVPPFSPWYHHQNYYRPFQPWHVPVQENWSWKSSYPAVNADAWGCPVWMPYAHCHISSPMPPPPTCNKNETDNNSSNGFSLDEEVLDKVMKEALANPWAPLPLGLTPPSTESVLSELHRLGIHTVPVLPNIPRTNQNLP